MTMMTLLIGSGIVALGAAAVAQSKPQMPADVGPGRVAWFDISTTDLARAQEFYGKLFGWTFSPVGSGAVEIAAGGAPIGTVRTASGPISTANGVVYIQVEDVQQASERATSLGGTVVPGFPFDLPDGRGAISLIVDPSGHPLGLYSRRPMAAKTP